MRRFGARVVEVVFALVASVLMGALVAAAAWLAWRLAFATPCPTSRLLLAVTLGAAAVNLAFALGASAWQRRRRPSNPRLVHTMRIP
jgi:Co/Zn/Cd efflux system component